MGTTRKCVSCRVLWWVWDSTWMPAVVVRRTQSGFVLVRFEHAVTCSVAMSDLQPRDLTARGNDRPMSGRKRCHEPVMNRAANEGNKARHARSSRLNGDPS